MTRVATLALEHLLLRLKPINRALRAAVKRQTRLAARLVYPDVTTLCITENQVTTLLDDADAFLRGDGPGGTSARLTTAESAQEDDLRKRSAAQGCALPLDQLAKSLSLSTFERNAVLLCAATELDRSYERIYAYILDDLNRRAPCVELLSEVTAESAAMRVAHRHALGRFGLLRRSGVLRAWGEPATELRQELRLDSGLFEILTGAVAAPLYRFRDHDAVPIPDQIDLPHEVDRERTRRLAEAISARSVTMVGLWGPRHAGHREVVLKIAADSGLPLRRWCPSPATRHSSERESELRQAIEFAAALETLLWIPSDVLREPENAWLHDLLVDQLVECRVPVIATGASPWRAPRVLEARGYAEMELAAPSYLARKSLWVEALPDVEEPQLRDLAARFRIGAAEVRAVARLARTRAQLVSNGHVAPVGEQLEAACATVTRHRSANFARVIQPRRSPEDLVLPPNLHRQVMEVAHFFRVWPQVAEGWGFGRLITGRGGIKALFTGDPGTGKTMAAEVIAGQLKMPLLRVDLARVVSKWVGETEKQLEEAFHEAEDSHSVLFFDEADALFGKRGEVQHGTDRYANMEVSYLLQRLEDHEGLVILASNLKDNIDAAFTRRLQVVIHFPRPEATLRLRIWKLALPSAAPVDAGIDFEALARLDLTGAGIVDAARTAALLAADEGLTVTIRHIILGIARQYQREARLLTASELGPYGALLQETR